MAIALRTQNTATANAPVDGIGTVALTGVQAGDLIVLCIAERNGNTVSSVTDNLNGAYTQAVALGLANIWYLPNASAGDPTITVTMGTTSLTFYLNASAWSGAKPSGVLDQTNSSANSAGTTHSHGSITTTDVGLIITCSGQSGAATETANANFTALSNNAGRDYFQYWITGGAQTTDGAYTTTETISSDGAIASFLAQLSSVSPDRAVLTLEGRAPTTSAFQNVRIREVLVNSSGQAVGNATDIGLRVWYGGICAGAPDLSLNGLTTDADGTTSWSIATGTLSFNDPIFYVSQNSVSYSTYAAARMVPSYESS